MKDIAPVILPQLDEFLMKELSALNYGTLEYIEMPELLRYRTVRAFITEASLDEKFLIMGKMGIQYAVLIKSSRKEALNWTEFKRVMKDFLKKGQNVNLMRFIENKGMFVFVDSNVMKSMSVIAAACNSVLYKLTFQFTHILEKIGMIRDIENVGVLNNDRNNLISVINFQLELYKLDDNYLELLGIGTCGHIILMYLYKADLPVSREAIVSDLIAYRTDRTISNKLNSLVETEFIKKYRLNNTDHFQINGKGCNVVAEIIKKIAIKMI